MCLRVLRRAADALAAVLTLMLSTKLSHTNPYLRDPAMRKRGLLISVASSSAIEGIHAPFKNAIASAKRAAIGATAVPRKSVTRAKR